MKVKLYPLSFIAFVLMILISGCKKDNKSQSSSEQSYTPLSVPPSAPGIIQLSSSELVLHINNTANVSVVLYNSNGTLYNPQPGFSWNNDTAQVVSLSSTSGSSITLTAVETGTATIGVTDGTHGFAYLQVTVVADTTQIPLNILYVTFSPPVITIAKNASGSFSYNVINLSGQSTGVTPTFIVTGSGGGISISGTTITAGSSTGLYTVIPVNGQDTLEGQLQVLVYDNQSTATDTTWQITNINDYTAEKRPFDFYNINEAAAPVIIQVTGYTTGKDPNIFVFKTSPTSIEIDHPGVITVQNGLITSVRPGWTGITYYYKNASFNDYIYVQVNFNGDWEGNGINICMGGQYTGVFYRREFSLFNGYPVSFTWNIQTGGCSDSSGVTGNLLHFYGQPIAGATVGVVPSSFIIGSVGVLNGQGTCAEYNITYQDNDHFIFKNTINKSSYTLTRGAGNCATASNPTPTPPNPSLTLAQALEGTTWTANNCWINGFGFDSSSQNPFIFYSNGSCVEGNPSDADNWAYWLTRGDTLLIVYEKGGSDSAGMKVTYYDKDSVIILDGIYDSIISPSTWSSGYFGCTPMLTGN